MGGAPAATGGLGSFGGAHQNQGQMSRATRRHHHNPRGSRVGATGFTLVEIMIAVAIVAILAAVALPTFLDALRKSRRTDAFNGITTVQQLQERWRGSHGSYAASLTNAAGDSPPGLGMASARTTKGYYDLTVSGTDASGYTVAATTVSGTTQAADSNCLVLAARVVAGGNLGYGAGATADSIDWADPKRCWAR